MIGVPLYKCNDCGHEFELPDRVKEYRGEFWGMPAYEEMAVCPMCHSGDFEEVNEDEDDDDDEESEGDENE